MEIDLSILWIKKKENKKYAYLYLPSEIKKLIKGNRIKAEIRENGLLLKIPDISSLLPPSFSKDKLSLKPARSRRKRTKQRK